MTEISEISSLKNKHWFIELLIVLSIGFGLFIWSSTYALLQHSGDVKNLSYNTGGFYVMACYEVVALICIAFYLKRRQWTLHDFNLNFKFNMIGMALLLIILRSILGIVIINLLVMAAIVPVTSNEPDVEFNASLVSMTLVLTINSIYEEVLLIGYLFKRLEKFHPSFIILISFIIRASYHTYQGWFNMPMVFTMALVFGLYYVKYKQLWPLILAHAIGNLFSFFNAHYHWLDY